MTNPRARVALHAVLSVVYTWPLVFWLTESLPNGTETPGTVAFFNLWTLRWDQQQIGDLFRHYWDAPIFHPEPGVFALSEPQPLTGLVFAPISWISGNPVLAYNLILLLAVTLNGLAAARLARRLGATPWPAALVGAIAQFLPFVTNELGVLQLVMVFPVLYTVDAILAWADDGGWVKALAIGAWLTATFFTCGYYGLFSVTVIAPATLLLVRRSWFRRERLLQLGAALALFAVTAGPFLLAQNHYTSGYSRPTSLVTGNSAPPGAYLRLDEILQGSKLTPWLNQEGGERLYPGTVLVGAAAVGAGVLLWRRRYRQTAFLGAVLVLGGVLSLGLRLDLWGWQPYELVREHLPGYRDLRSPFRAGVYVQVALLPLAGAALDALWRLRWAEAPPAGAEAPAAHGEPADEVLDLDRVAAAPGPAADAEAATAVEAGNDLDGAAEEGEEAAQPAGEPVAVPVMAAAEDGSRAWAPVGVDSPGGPLPIGEEGPATPPPAGDTVASASPAPAAPASGPAVVPLSGPAGWRAAVARGWSVVVEVVRRAPPWLGPALATLLVVVGLAEVHPGEQQLVAVPPTGTDVDWVGWLAQHHETPTGDGSVAMVPFPANGNYVSYEPTTLWMLSALDHGHPLVNGYSGFFPESYDRAEEEARKAFPSDSAVRELAEHHTTWVVMDRNALMLLDPQIMPAWTDVLRPVFEGERAVVYELHAEAL